MKRMSIHSKSIYVQLVMYSLIISLIPIVIISGLMFRKLKSMVMEELHEYHDQITAQYCQNLEEKLEQYRLSLDYLSNNTIILNTLTDAQGDPYRRGVTISEEVNKSLLLDQASEVRNCMIYSIIEDVPVYGGSVSMMREASREVWYLKQRASTENWFCYFALQKEKPVLSLIKNIEQLDTLNLTKTQLGIVKLDMDMQRLFSPAPLEGASQAAYDVIVYDQDFIFYSTIRDAEKLLEDYNALPREGLNSVRELDTFVIRQRELSDYGLGLLLLFDNKEVLERQRESWIIVLPMALVLTAIVLSIARLYSKSFSSRIERLVWKFKQAETGDLTIHDPIEGNDEIAVLDGHFSHMLTQLDQLIKTNYIQQLENKETQLRNLQLQINPHFLYNTLETISSIAAVRQVFVVCDMCQRLGEIFRYSLGKNYGEIVPLRLELDHIKNYIFIQKIRYGNRFKVCYNIEAGSEDYRIMRFLLQPIVENAIIHGLAGGNPAAPGTLEISVSLPANALTIQISDNGKGMEEQKVAELTAYINHTDKTEDTAGSIGIRNVHQRIRLACGGEYGVSIESRPGAGSRFTVRLPIIRGENDNET